MHRARAFFYVSLGILALAVSFHLGARTASGQSPINSVATATPVTVVMGNGSSSSTGVILTNGDLWIWDGIEGHSAQFSGNLFSGAPVQTIKTTWGRIKADRR